MDDRHLRSVIRASLRASGFDPPIGDLIASDRRKGILGLKLRNRLLTNLPNFASATDILKIAQQDSRLWSRLPGMLAFGHEQAVVFRSFIHSNHRNQAQALLMPISTFSAGISLLDYLADDFGLAGPIFEVLDEATVTNLFTNGSDADARLSKAYGDARDVRLRLLFALVAMCAAGIRGLYRRGGNRRGWHDLMVTFSELHAAQRATSFGPAGSGDSLCGVVTTKSVLPFVAAHQIVELFDRPAAVTASSRDLARQMGRAIAMIDDLVDLLCDWGSGAPNSVLVKQRLTDGKPTDVQLYGLIEGVAAEVVLTLKSASLLYSPQQLATVRRAPIDRAAKFATLTIARWVGWREELSGTSVFAFRRPRPTGALLESSVKAANFLLEEQRAGYQEAIHWIDVPRFDGDAITIEMHAALLFQRACILDCLLDAYLAGLDIPTVVLAEEALQVLKSKRDDVGGGWSYLSDVQELPPDVDDLAIVLQVILRYGGHPLASVCQHAFSLVFDKARRGEAITTWIVDPDDEPQSNETFRRYIELTQAEGVHPEVVANFLFAASLYSGNKVSDTLNNSISWLESAQTADGSWRSRWYWGSHYGTYRALSALRSLAPDSHALDRASKYLESGQNSDGGWGSDGLSDPLSTAFAALGFAALARPGARRYITSALNFLVASQQADGSWPACPFVAFPRIGASGVHVYSSRTVTTSFCLKAILACRRVYLMGPIEKSRTGSAPLPYRFKRDQEVPADWS